MIKKIFISLGIVLLLSFASCGGGSSKEAKKLMTRILQVVGVPFNVVANICQDSNNNGICEAKELHTKVTINKGDDFNSIIAKISLTDEGKYFLENYDSTKKILMEIQDSTNVVKNDGKFTFRYNPKTQELSILQMMIDEGFLTPDDVNAVRSMSNVDDFYETLFKDFETNLNTLGEKELSSPRAVLANMREMADELILNGVRDTLPQSINDCNGSQSCIDETLAPLSEELKIDENESESIKSNETKITKELLTDKKFYVYDNDTKSIDSLVVNAQADSWSYQGSTESIEINGDRLTFLDDGSYAVIVKRDKYLELTDYHADGTIDEEGHRLYFNESDAEDYLNSKAPNKNMDKAKFDLPNKYYNNIKYDNDGNDYSAIYFEADAKEITTTIWKNIELTFNGDKFVKEESNNGYSLRNGLWIEHDKGETFTLSADKKVLTFEDFQVTFKSVVDLEGQEEGIKDYDVKVLMPKGAERYQWTYIRTADSYYLSHEKSGYSTLSEEIAGDCDKHQFTSNKDENGGIAFDCNDKDKSSGGLVMSQDDSEELIYDVGTWKIITLPNSNIEAILTDIKPEYNKHSDSPMFAIKDGSVWRGEYDKADGQTYEFDVYNQVAFDAFEAKIKSLGN